MRPSVRKLRVVAFLGAICAAGCQYKAPTESSGLTLDNVMKALRHEGVTVSRVGAEPRDAFPFFAAQPTRLVLNGDDVHVFEYPTETLAMHEASTVAAAGTPIGTTQVGWIVPPRFYRRDRFIVLYVGTTTAVIRALGTVFGTPFAGER